MGSCPECGKVRFPSRAAAKREAKKFIASGKANTSRMRVYQCGDFWHLASWQNHERTAFFRDSVARKYQPWKKPKKEEKES